MKWGNKIFWVAAIIFWSVGKAKQTKFYFRPSLAPVTYTEHYTFPLDPHQHIHKL
jgi:hypothetical protein